jgi:uncharacterized membrane protein YfcA
MPELFWWQWGLGALCAANVGMAKTGMPGMGVMVVPLMVLTVGDARLSAGWLLPILCMADVVAIWYWRRHAAAGRLFSLAPFVAIGIAGGAFTLSLNEFVLRKLVGIIIALMLCAHLWRRYSKSETKAHPLAYGVAAGYSTTVANAAGPVMNLYLLSQKLPKEEFVATGAWFFFFVNLSKVPIYAWHGLMSRSSLIFDAVMFPAILAGALLGRFLLHRISPKVFENSILVLTVISTLLLFK